MHTRKPAEYLDQARAVLGNPAMSDRELGERLGGYSQQHIAKAKHGNMSVPLAMKVAETIGVDVGEAIIMAWAERETNEEVKAVVASYLSKIQAAMSPRTAPAEQPRGGMAAMVEQLAAEKKTPPAKRGRRVGGEGGIRTLGTGIPYA